MQNEDKLVSGGRLISLQMYHVMAQSQDFSDASHPYTQKLVHVIYNIDNTFPSHLHD